MIDAGITKENKHRHNLATIPVLWRNADILIICDSPGNPSTDEVADHLAAASEEAASLGLPFPQIHAGSQHENAVRRSNKEVSSLFVQEGTPLVIYMKGKKHPTYKDGSFNPDANIAKFTDTYNFNYSPDNYSLLTGLTEHIFKDPATIENIKMAIELAVKRKKALN